MSSIDLNETHYDLPLQERRRWAFVFALLSIVGLSLFFYFWNDDVFMWRSVPGIRTHFFAHQARTAGAWVAVCLLVLFFGLSVVSGVLAVRRFRK